MRSFSLDSLKNNVGSLLNGRVANDGTVKSAFGNINISCF